MKKLALFVAALVFAAPSFAQVEKGRADAKERRGDDDRRGGPKEDRGAPAWAPRQVTREDKRGIDAYYRKLDEAWQKRDLQTVMQHIDFPILMVTDDARGEGSGEYWSREQYLREMSQAMGGMPADMQIKARRKPFFVTNDLAVVQVENEVRMGGRKLRYRGADLLMRRNGQWVSKAAIEGGWGGAEPTPAPQRPQGGTVAPGGHPHAPKDHRATPPAGRAPSGHSGGKLSAPDAGVPVSPGKRSNAEGPRMQK